MTLALDPPRVVLGDVLAAVERLTERVAAVETRLEREAVAREGCAVWVNRLERRIEALEAREMRTAEEVG